jgi:hypothetical protein
VTNATLEYHSTPNTNYFNINLIIIIIIYDNTLYTIIILYVINNLYVISLLFYLGRAPSGTANPCFQAFLVMLPEVAPVPNVTVLHSVSTLNLIKLIFQH